MSFIVEMSTRTSYPYVARLRRPIGLGLSLESSRDPS